MPHCSISIWIYLTSEKQVGFGRAADFIVFLRIQKDDHLRPNYEAHRVSRYGRGGEPPSPSPQDKFAFSVIWRLSPEGEILSEWFGKSVIHNYCRSIRSLLSVRYRFGLGQTHHFSHSICLSPNPPSPPLPACSWDWFLSCIKAHHHKI